MVSSFTIAGNLSLTNVQESAVYTVTVSNPAGAIVSLPILVSVVPSLPEIVSAPLDLSVNSSRTAVFTVDARGTDPRTYQWFFNNNPVGNGGQTLSVPNVTAAIAGEYVVVVRNSLGTVTSRARLTVDDTSRLTNVATRGFSGTGENVLIVGFAITGPTSKTVLLRGIGPGLVPFGVTGTLTNPKLTLFDASGAKLAENDDWGGGTALVNAFTQAGAFTLPGTGLDSAMLRTLSHGLYTVQLSDVGGGTGVGLIEIYESDLQPSRVVNLSSRVVVGTGAAVAIPGIVIAGTVSKKLLIRGIGPTLATFGVQGPLPNPVLTVIGASGVTVASNDDWGSANNPAEIITTSAAVGAFALPTLSKDSALLVTLSPGSYTALVSGANDTTGIALVEVYEVP